MEKTLDLFIDELGNSDPGSSQSEIYVLCGCAFPEDSREIIKNLADQIKFKYWNKTDIIFHSRDIGKNLGDFIIFKDEIKKENFTKDLFGFLNKIPVTVLAIVVDKKTAKKYGWNQNKIIKETSYKLILHFLALLYSREKRRGKIIIESATSEKDVYYLKAFSYFLSPGFKELNENYKINRKTLTSISFVTKDNLDIEEQITDLFSYAAKCKFDAKYKNIKFGVKSYEYRILKLLEQKLFKANVYAGDHKKKFYERIVPFCIMPET